VIWDHFDNLFFKKFNGLNCFFRSCTVLTANIFRHLPLSDFALLLEVLDSSYRCLEVEHCRCELKRRNRPQRFGARAVTCCLFSLASVSRLYAQEFITVYLSLSRPPLFTCSSTSATAFCLFHSLTTWDVVIPV
jgi:hypothetical protein